VLVYHEKDIVLPGSAMFQKIQQRFLSLLRPEVLIQLRKSRAQLNSHVQEFGDGKPGKFHECDFSKFDKSQQAMALRLEYYIYYMLGLDVDALNNWIRGNLVSNVSTDIGVRFLLALQRKSGTPTTTLGNTIVTMAAIASTYDISSYGYCMFIGDDFIMKTNAKLSLSQIESRLRFLYNLSGKVICSNYGYFASSYIIDEPTACGVVADPIKRALSFRDLSVELRKMRKGAGVIEKNLIREHYESYKDIMVGYSNGILMEALARAVAYRVTCNGNKDGGATVYPLLQGLYTLTTSFEHFETLYDKYSTVING